VAGEALSALLVVSLVCDAGDVGAVPLTQLSGDALAALVMMAALRPAVSAVALRSAWRTAVPVLREAWPVVLNSLLALLVFNADLIILRLFRDSATVGQYAAAYMLVSFLANLGTTYGFAVMPQVARSAADPASRNTLVRGALVFALALTLPIAVGGLFTADGLVGLVFGGGYAGSGLPLRILLLSVPLAWLRAVAHLTLVALGRQRAVLGVTALGAVVTVVFDLALIPRFGMPGAAGVTVAAEGIRLVAMLAVLAGAGIALPSLTAWWRPVLGTAAMTALLVAWQGPVLAVVATGAGVYLVAVLLTGAVRRGADGRLGIRL
jgi:O-antigen/teichoic acid export membrane protein